MTFFFQKPFCRALKGGVVEMKDKSTLGLKATTVFVKGVVSGAKNKKGAGRQRSVMDRLK